MGHSLKTAALLMASDPAIRRRGDTETYFELGMAWSTGTAGAGIDLVQAHKWFNLAALGGCMRAQEARADIAADMSLREIAEAQRQARAWLSAERHDAA